MDNLTKTIAHSWGWTGIQPKEIVGGNDFGNLIVKDLEGKCWRLCPEDTYCEVIPIEPNLKPWPAAKFFCKIDICCR